MNAWGDRASCEKDAKTHEHNQQSVRKKAKKRHEKCVYEIKSLPKWIETVIYSVVLYYQHNSLHHNNNNMSSRHDYHRATTTATPLTTFKTLNAKSYTQNISGVCVCFFFVHFSVCVHRVFYVSDAYVYLFSFVLSSLFVRPASVHRNAAISFAAHCQWISLLSNLFSFSLRRYFFLFFRLLFSWSFLFLTLSLSDL